MPTPAHAQVAEARAQAVAESMSMLTDLFPDAEQSVLEAVLRSAGDNVEEAANILFGMTEEQRNNAPPAAAVRTARHFNEHDSAGTMLRLAGTAEPNFTGYTVPNGTVVEVVGEQGDFSHVICPPGRPANCGWVRTMYLTPPAASAI